MPRRSPSWRRRTPRHGEPAPSGIPIAEARPEAVEHRGRHGKENAMTFALSFYHDQIDASGATTSALPACHRLLYVRHGGIVINGKPMNADEAAYCNDPVTMQSSGSWSQIWRWDIAPPTLHPCCMRVRACCPPSG